VVPSNASTLFKGLNLSPRVLQNLAKKGYKEAFAVQAGVLPLLLEGSESYNGDLCVSAATGSGKTLAYILPMIEDLQRKSVTSLRGLIVVPTRELVTQVREVAELCASGTGLRIGTAVGSTAKAEEEEMLLNRGLKYDPKGASELQQVFEERLRLSYDKEDMLLQNAQNRLPDHIQTFESSVDILICTPGRLVDHIRSTQGFTLKDTKWLVIDEADRLLDQSFQEWADTLHNAIYNRNYRSKKDAILSRMWNRQETKFVRKVILSATMTRDLNKLASLKLRKPTLVAIANQDGRLDADATEDGALKDFDLPATLAEWAIPVGDGSDKPLFMLQLLRDQLLATRLHDKTRHVVRNTGAEAKQPQSSDDDSSSESSSEPSDSDDDSDINTDSSDSDVDMKDVDESPSTDLAGKANVLIFTSNNENATRLSHLLRTLDPTYAKLIGTLTKSAASSESRKVLNNFRSGKIQVLIASDRASRGLDVPDLAHIVNYDVPRSLTSYIHRVGRTARAGRTGEAWTFFTDSEGRWFWNSIARAPEIGRGEREVHRFKVDIGNLGEDKRKQYEGALKKLQTAVLGR
jgi:ATP-dependent RNA helicase DDX51/DBP6